MGIKITQDEPDTGGPNRTERKRIQPLVTGNREVNPEVYVDCSPSMSWPWKRDRSVNTWSVMVPSLKGVTEPFALLDSQAAAELAEGIAAGGAEEAGGVEIWAFSDTHLAFSNKRDAEGDLIIDANPDNFDERWAAFVQMHRDHFDSNGMPEYGGTEVMAAVQAGDSHFLDEFNDRAVTDRPLRVRFILTDGALEDKRQFIQYLSQATPVQDPTVSTTTTIGRHGEWDEVWIAGIFGEEGGGGHKAYDEYAELAKDHPWIYPLYFENVVNSAEATEDIALAGFPAPATAA